jgi:hypothetical protein
VPPRVSFAEPPARKPVKLDAAKSGAAGEAVLAKLIVLP